MPAVSVDHDRLLPDGGTFTMCCPARGRMSVKSPGDCPRLWPEPAVDERRGWNASRSCSLARRAGRRSPRRASYLVRSPPVLAARRLVDPLQACPSGAPGLYDGRRGNRLRPQRRGARQGGRRAHNPVPARRRGDPDPGPIFLARTDGSLRVPGRTACWWTRALARNLSHGLGVPVAPGLILLRLSGAPRWPSGSRSTNTQWSRIATYTPWR